MSVLGILENLGISLRCQPENWLHVRMYPQNGELFQNQAFWCLLLITVFGKRYLEDCKDFPKVFVGLRIIEA